MTNPASSRTGSPRTRLVLDPGTRRVDRRTLVGGSPLRVFRLGERGADALDAWERGEPVDDRTMPLARRLLDAGAAHPRPTGGTFTRDDVTVVVPVHDDPAGLAATLACEPAALVVRDDDGRGPAWARNRGWRQATTPLVAFLDADCRPTDDWLDRLLPQFDDDSVAAVAPRVTSGPPRSGVLARYEVDRSPLDLGHRESIVRPRARVPYVPTAALVIRRADLEALGGFDESMRYGEDVDLVWRLVAAGRAVRYDPDVLVEHPPRTTVGGWLRQRFSYGTAAAPLARRHGAAVAPLVTSPWTAAAWGATALGQPLLGAATAVGSAAVLARRLTGVPPEVSVRLALTGHARAGAAVAEAIRRPWWPLTIGLLGWRRTRPAMLAVLAAPLVDWRPNRGNPATWLALRLADDLAYGAGVWVGCLRERSLAALRPVSR